MYSEGHNEKNNKNGMLPCSVAFQNRYMPCYPILVPDRRQICITTSWCVDMEADT